MLNTLTNNYLKLADYFIPENIISDRDAHKQARMFLISHTMGPFLGNTVPLALYMTDPTPGWDIVLLALSITAFWMFPVMMKYGVRFNTLVLTSVLNLNFCIFLSCFFNGGVLSPTLSWILIIPLLSFFYIGGERKLQSTLLYLFSSCFLIFLGLYFYFDPPNNDIPEYMMTWLGIVSTVATLLYVATMAIYYSRIFDVGVELENEVRRRRLASEELRIAMAETDRAGRMKAEFLARMSHELRTPLNAVVGYSQILAEETSGTADRQMSRDINKIHEAGQYLVRLINMILDLSKIETGNMTFDIRAHSVNAIIENAVAGASETIKGNGNQIEMSLFDGDGSLKTDDTRLIQILDAILQNAGEHTKDGTVTVACQSKVSSEGRTFNITVSDTGCGIEEGRLSTILTSLFDKRDASSTRYGGTGLNLSVVYRLAQELGYDIEIESAVNVGSSFTVVVPEMPRVSSPALDLEPEEAINTNQATVGAVA